MRTLQLCLHDRHHVPMRQQLLDRDLVPEPFDCFGITRPRPIEELPGELDTVVFSHDRLYDGIPAPTDFLPKTPFRHVMMLSIEAAPGPWSPWSRLLHRGGNI